MPRKTRAGAGRGRRGPRRASMRPRPDAAENTRTPRTRHAGRRGFNEAAARCRGKREPSTSDSHLIPRASMRPRPDAAENIGEEITKVDAEELQ